MSEIDLTPTERGGPPVPDTLDEAYTPAWLSAALGTRYPGIEVTSVTPGPVISRVATNARFHIECAGGTPDGLSPDLCIKGYFTEYGKPYRHAGVPEAAFYRDVLGLTGMNTLRCVYADCDPETSDSAVITEDVVAQGAEFLDARSAVHPRPVRPEPGGAGCPCTRAPGWRRRWRTSRRSRLGSRCTRRCAASTRSR